VAFQGHCRQLRVVRRHSVRILRFDDHHEVINTPTCFVGVRPRLVWISQHISRRAKNDLLHFGAQEDGAIFGFDKPGWIKRVVRDQRERRFGRECALTLRSIPTKKRFACCAQSDTDAVARRRHLFWIDDDYVADPMAGLHRLVKYFKSQEFSKEPSVNLAFSDNHLIREFDDYVGSDVTVDRDFTSQRLPWAPHTCDQPCNGDGEQICYLCNAGDGDQILALGWTRHPWRRVLAVGAL
jgi:hypothetical protein